ncbi:hypothetical protein ACJ6WF_19085 [Streptomyces sp. MMS24-I2-30]|uniref:hypothetical protein n=1 Tax=Streptomyces sp. MMS24-I2-30 TaxID=3351564 RepID=UPI0038969E79
MNQIPPPFSELTLAATPNAVAWARRHTVDVLQRWHFPTESTEVARLLISELRGVRSPWPRAPARPLRRGGRRGVGGQAVCWACAARKAGSATASGRRTSRRTSQAVSRAGP